MSSVQRYLALVVVLGTLTLRCGKPALGQCEPRWLPGEGLLGTNGPVNAAIIWDPDGEGPQAELMVVGGQFDLVDSVLCRNVAAWDGTRWQALNGGTNAAVQSFAVYNGELVAAGNFTTIKGFTAFTGQ